MLSPPDILATTTPFRLTNLTPNITNINMAPFLSLSTSFGVQTVKRMLFALPFHSYDTDSKRSDVYHVALHGNQVFKSHIQI